MGLVPAVAVIAGLVAVLVGSWLIYPPLSLVLGGVALLGAGLFVDWDAGSGA
jgi:hypothetical protein